MLVIFDCDGVLVDSEILSAQVFSECLAEDYDIHVSPHYSLEAYRGKSVPDCISMITEELTEKLNWQDLPQAERDERGRNFWRRVQLQTLVACENRLFPVIGVENVLKQLQDKKIPFCVASNGRHEKMAVTLVKTNLLKYVEGNIFSFEDVARGKPAPDLFLYAAKTMGVPASDAIVVEDSLTGVIAAKAAGMRPLAYCPPDDEGIANSLVGEMRNLGAEVFTSMDDLIALILESAAKPA